MKSKIMSTHIIRFGFYGLVLMVVAGMLYTIHLLFIPLIISLFLTFLIQPAVNYLEARGLNRTMVIAGFYMAVMVILVLGLFLVIPIIINQAQNLMANYPIYDKQLQTALVGVREMILKTFPGITIPDIYGFFKSKLFQNSGKIMASIPSLMSSVFSILSVVVIIPIATFFFLTEGHLVQKALLKMVPNRYFEMFILLFHKMAFSLERFIRGQLIDVTVVTVMTSIGLAMAGLPYYMVIGIIAGLGNMIPYLGPVIGFVPAFLILLISGLTTLGLIKIILVFVVVQFIESTFIYPIVVGKSVNLHPLVVIIGVLAGGQLGGVVGMLIAIPLISVVKVAIEVLYTNLKRYSII